MLLKIGSLGIGVKEMRAKSGIRSRRAVVFVSGLISFFALSLLFVSSASAQLGGEQIRGDLGLKSGSQAPPGLYVAETLYFYRPTEVTGQSGAALPGGIDLNLFAPVLGLNYVSNW